jgi:RNA polymerase sigma factor (TIGR02999 family)
VTLWLERLRAGDERALDELVARLYSELRAVARGLLRGERPGRTLATTALVHEAYLRLLGSHALAPRDRGAFLAAAAVTMRRILVDAARRRLAAKRGGESPRVDLDEIADAVAAPAADEELLRVDAALAELERAAPRARQIVELRFFVGASLAETAEALSLSTKTVQRDWLAARAWLRARIAGESPAASDP